MVGSSSIKIRDETYELLRRHKALVEQKMGQRLSFDQYFRLQYQQPAAARLMSSMLWVFDERI